jgi:alpha-tubulin suppressor-like RCC1 family protein
VAQVSGTLTRREALALLPAVPAAFAALAQTPPAPARLRRLVSNGRSYIIEADGRVKAWTTSPNTKAMYLGLDGDADRIVPRWVAVEVTPIEGATTIALGTSSYAVTPDGRVLAWGSTENGLLGNTPMSELELTRYPHPPAPMPTFTLSMPKVIDVSSQRAHVLALTAEGTVFAWGNGQVGQLGIGRMPVISLGGNLPEPLVYLPFPVRVPELEGVTAIATGSNHSIALLKDGTVRAWGENRYGEVGDGTVVQRHAPVTVRGVANAVAIAAGPGSSFAVLADGGVVSWGAAAALGRPTTARRGGGDPVPAPVPGASGVTAISAGAQHAVALTSTGRVLAWGEENVGQVGHATPAKAGPVPTITTARTVYATAASSFAILADGTILVWGALPSLSFRIDGADGEAAHFPIPLIVKGL